jgi:CO dehydrogenase/acetyl-CoA synthase beta subunit
MNLEQRLNELADALATHVDGPTIDEFRDFLGAGEYGVGLEYVCDRLSDDEEPVTRGEADLIRELARQMRLTRPSIDEVEDLVIAEP